MENEINIPLVFWAGSAFMIVAIITILLVIVMYYRILSIHKKDEAERLLKNSVESEKSERLRIARDLHDDISGDLNAIANYITIIKKTTPDEKSKLLADEVAAFVNNTLKNVQLISYNLIPPQLETLGLIPALEDYFQRVRNWNNIAIDIKYNKSKIPLHPSYKYELFRIVQELTNNMLRHGLVSHFTFQIQIEENTTSITINDNGIAFDFYKAYNQSTGLGLKNIVSRIKHIDAELKQHSNQDGNTTIILIPNISAPND